MIRPLRRRGHQRVSRLAALTQLEQDGCQDAHEQFSASHDIQPMDVGHDDVSQDESHTDFTDSPVDLNEVELSQQLLQIRDDAGTVLESLQDEEPPTVEELYQLVDFQNIDDDPTADEMSDDEDLNNNNVPSDMSPLDMSPPDMSPTRSMQPEQQATSIMGMSRKAWDASDTSEAIPHHRNLVLMPDLHMSLAIWAQTHGISESTYRGLREILETNITPETIGDIHALPVAVGTLKKGLRKRLPLLEIRKAPISLRPEKLPSDHLRRFEDKAPTQDLHFFNPIEYIKALLRSSIKNDMYFGMALLVDEQDRVDPWHSRAWASSARSTSGQYAHYSDGTAVIPSDFIHFKCHNAECITCQSPQASHVGRVVEVWRDQRSTPLVDKDAVVLLVEPLLNLANMKATLREVSGRFKGYPHGYIPPNEYVMVKDQRLYIAEDHVIDRIKSVCVDYTFGSAVELDQDNPDLNSSYLVRRKVNIDLWRFFPVVKSTPIRGELEIEEFTRQAIIESFDRRDIDVFNVGLILFADGFGLYRTMHKSIMGIYLSIASLKRADRLRQMNTVSLTLGPHASNDNDVWNQIGGKLRELEEGFICDIHGKPAFISAHVLFLAGDFPQQQDNSGFRRPTATQGCRMCDVTLTDRGDLNFDLTSGEHQRHHHEIIRQRTFMASKDTKSQREAAADRFGLAVDNPALLTILPALDIIKSRPPDAAHSEFGGITKMIHLELFDQVLTPTGCAEYAKALRVFPRPTGWGRIQSPHHILQYSLTEHGRWSVIAPLLMRTWLKYNPKYIKVSFARSIMSVFQDDIRMGLFGSRPEPADIIIRILVENVRSNILLTTDRMGVGDRDRQKFDDQVKRSRRLFQLFCQAASEAVRSRRSRSRSAGPSVVNIPTVASGTEEITSGPAAISAAIALQSNEDIEDPPAMESADLTTTKSTKYHLWMSRPNVHIGLHYANVVDEYGLVSLPMVLAFELKHKLWKRVVYTTNHKAPEKDLFTWENINQTMRFLLLGAFADTDSELTEQVTRFNKTMPSLCSFILRGTHIEGENDEYDEDNTYQHSIISTLRKVDERHGNATVIGRLNTKICREMHLPTKESQMDPLLRSQVTAAYSVDYHRQVTLMGSSQVLKWWKKISWDEKDPSTGLPKRVTKNRGQYVQYTDALGLRYGRLDQIFTHEPVRGMDATRAFLMITPAITADNAVDSSTGLQLYMLERPTIIGLTRLSDEIVYMVPFEEFNSTALEFNGTKDEDRVLLHVTWNIGFM